MLDPMNRSLCFLGNLFEPHPDQNGTADMVTDNPCFPALTALQSSELFGFSVKLLNLPPQATHLLYNLRVILSQVVRDDLVRAQGRQHHSEQIHFR